MTKEDKKMITIGFFIITFVIGLLVALIILGS